jgi:hypothetical protein
VRTEQRYRHVSGLEVDITTDPSPQNRKAFERVVGRFPDFCIVTESIRGNFPIKVRVHHPWDVFKHVLPVRS